MHSTKHVLQFAVTLTAFGVLVPALAAARGRPAPRCDRAVQVMSTPHLSIVRGLEHASGAYGFYACTRRSRRGSWLFDADADGIRVRIEAAAAGWFVAFASYVCNKNTGRCSEAAIKVYDGRTRRTRIADMRKGPDGSPLYDAYEPGVTRTGWAAWIVPRQTTPVLLDVYTMAPDGTLNLIATSPGIDRRSLATNGRQVYWTDSGQPRSAPLHFE